MSDLEVTDFARDVLERSHSVPVLVDFWAAWCGPCAILGPVLERVAERFSGQVVVVKVDTETHQDLAAEYGIRSIPAVKLFVDGKVASEFTGALPEPAVVRWLEKALPDPDRKLLDEAESLLLAGSAEKARTALEPVLARNPHHERARTLKARLLLSRNPDAAADLVAGIEPHSDQFHAAEMITTIASLVRDARDPARLPEDPAKALYAKGAQEASKENYAVALEHFIEVIRIHRSYHDDAARKACIAIFRLLGDEHDITRSRRRDFSSALNS